MMKLYTYFRSTAAYRVRIGLNLKQIEFDQAFVHLLRNKGEHRSLEYRSVNPQGRIPSLVLNDVNTSVLIQSMAILEYLEEVYPTPAFLPLDAVSRAHVRAVASIIGCDIHPLNNLSPLIYLRQNFKTSEEQVTAWITEWAQRGFEAIEALIGDSGYCFGDEPTLADIFLIPQVFAARRFHVPLEAFPRILRVDEHAKVHPAFYQADPSVQQDSE
jgi:maleylacetoacetate isomerase